MHARRRFIRIASIQAAAFVLASKAHAADPPMVDEKDPAAQALGYVADASKANRTKYPQYKPGQKCALCSLYQAPATAATGPCALFAGKRVAADAWCSAFAPK